MPFLLDSDAERFMYSVLGVLGIVQVWLAHLMKNLEAFEQRVDVNTAGYWLRRPTKRKRGDRKLKAMGKGLKRLRVQHNYQSFLTPFNSCLLWTGAWGEPEKSTQGEGVDRSCYAHLKHIFEILMNNHFISWQHEIYLQNVEIFISVFKHVCTFQELL